MRPLAVLVFCLFIVGVLSCSSSNTRTSSMELINSPSHKLIAGDLLCISVHSHLDWSGAATIPTTGSLILPGFGPIENPIGRRLDSLKAGLQRKLSTALGPGVAVSLMVIAGDPVIAERLDLTAPGVHSTTVSGSPNSLLYTWSAPTAGTSWPETPNLESDTLRAKWTHTPKLIITEHSTGVQANSIRCLDLTGSVDKVVILDSAEIDRNTVLISFTKDAAIALGHFHRANSYYAISYRGIITVVDEHDLSLTRIVTDQEVADLRQMCKQSGND